MYSTGCCGPSLVKSQTFEECRWEREGEGAQKERSIPVPETSTLKPHEEIEVDDDSRSRYLRGTYQELSEKVVEGLHPRPDLPMAAREWEFPIDRRSNQWNDEGVPSSRWAINHSGSRCRDGSKESHQKIYGSLKVAVPKDKESVR